MDERDSQLVHHCLKLIVNLKDVQLSFTDSVNIEGSH